MKFGKKKFKCTEEKHTHTHTQLNVHEYYHLIPSAILSYYEDKLINVKDDKPERKANHFIFLRCGDAHLDVLVCTGVDAEFKQPLA